MDYPCCGDDAGHSLAQLPNRAKTSVRPISKTHVTYTARMGLPATQNALLFNATHASPVTDHTHTHTPPSPAASSRQTLLKNDTPGRNTRSHPPHGST